MSTLRQVAKTCNVSPMTVSFVLNNKEGEVSEETRERVLKAVRDLNYRPAARRTRETRGVCTLGVVAGVSGHSLLEAGYYRSILHGILVAADDQNHNLTLFSNNLMHTDTRRSIRVYCDGRCDGLLVVAPNIGAPLVKALKERGIPIVLIGDTGDDETTSIVDVDNASESRKVVRYLISRSHRRIGFIGGAAHIRSAQLRADGYRDELAAHGIPLDESFIFREVQREANAVAIVSAMVSRPRESRPTAIFCWNDNAATFAMRAAKDLGFSVPRDLSIIGFDDHASSVASDPPLTTVRQPFDLIGRRAVDILLSQIRCPREAPKREFVDGEIIERESVGPPPEI